MPEWHNTIIGGQLRWLQLNICYIIATMAGLFGLVNTRTPVDIHAFLESAGKKMCHRSWHVLENWISPEIQLGVGRIGLGIFNLEPQPITSADGMITLWLTGEFYKTDELTATLKLDPDQRGMSDPELAMAGYQASGLDFSRQLNGPFFIVIYDRYRQKIILTNDRFGLYPHYFAVSSLQLVFAPEVKGVLCAPGIERKPDLSAACEYLRFQQILGAKTFHEGISLFPYGSLAQYDINTGDWSIQRYWDWDQVPYRPEVSFHDAAEEVGRLLEKAVQRLSSGIRAGVFLSGGLDSRTILGLIPEGSSHPVVSATFGQRSSRDVIYAKKIARMARSQHHWFDLPNGKWVLDHVDDHFQLVEGFQSWVHMHGITMLEDLRPHMDCNLSGWDGGTVMGHSDHINPIYNRPVDLSSVTVHTYQQFVNAYTWPGITDAEEHRLFSPDFRAKASWRAFESLSEELSRFWNFRREYAGEYFYIVNHCWRSTQGMITTTRSALETRFPFWDYDLIDFMYSLKPEIRRDQLLLRMVITRYMPRLALIPYDKQEFLPTLQPVLYQAQKAGMKALKKLNIIPDRPLLYADYENYLRSDLRSWAEDILFSPRSAQRGIYNMDFVRSLMDRHMANNEAWTLGKIAPLITYEMVMRNLFD